MRVLAVLVTVVVMLVGGWLVLRALDDPGGADESLREAGVTTTEPVVSEVLQSTVPRSICDSDARAIETAETVFEVAEGHPPASVQEIVDAGYLAEVSAYNELDVAADGTVTVVATSGAGCD